MQPLNGRCAMTRDERNARRRELMKDPFYHELILKRNRKNWAKNRDKRNARLRERLEAMSPEEKEAYVAKRREQSRERRKRNAQHINARQRAYYAAHVDKFHEYARKKRERDIASGKEAARIARNSELRRKRLATSPEARAKFNEQCRNWRKSKNGIEYRRKMMEKSWERVVSGGAQKIRLYMTHARPENRRAFSIWYQRRLINTKDGLGHIVEEADGLVAR